MVDQNDIAADKYLKTDAITFEELPYIQKYQNLLQLPDKETSLKLFTKQEPEPQQIVILKTRHAENAGKIEKGLQRLKSLEGAIPSRTGYCMAGSCQYVQNPPAGHSSACFSQRRGNLSQPLHYGKSERRL